MVTLGYGVVRNMCTQTKRKLFHAGGGGCLLVPVSILVLVVVNDVNLMQILLCDC